ncbi:hypothetical protein CK556_02670 [Mesoplasma chauliocola]|uniref:Phosphatidic acid phosphatase type 2/haloperoxidase domain-containing protein n=1 Tax=Mesoplasma chauliocola TaxID=216427 RepID=A0A249SNS4_9MOLU|nr:phosphatase PAP2 family protein [Mesoplasma chauliocola]ASZ09243.1 hypothetical protein CK556_02670 [Mesoplasma chauliocola]
MKLKLDKKILKTPYLYVTATIFALLIIVFLLGTFLDAQIAQNIYKENSWYGYAFDKFGQLTFLIPINFCIIGIFVFLSDKRKEWDVQLNIFKIVYFTLIYAGTIMYIFSPLIRKNSKPYELSIDIVNTIIFYSIFILTIVFYKMNPKFTEQKNFIFKVCLVIGFVITISLTTEILKNVFSRPRPINSVISGELEYREWWNITYANGFGKNKSFPSGHTTSAITILGLALLFKKDSLYYYGIILISFISAILVGTSRMVLAKHFLTDITFACIMAYSWFLFFENYLVKVISKKFGGNNE